MNSILKSIIWVSLLGLLSCKKEESIKFHLDSIEPNKYYENELIPNEYKMIYGKWKLQNVSGGFSGGGHSPTYDYLEIKNIGIYGLVRGDSLFEYGKIELANFDNNSTEFLQVKLIPEYHLPGGSNMTPPEKYIHLESANTLTLNSRCCDMFNYHYTRVK